MSQQQDYAHHVKFDPLYHFFLAPVAGIALIWMIVRVFMTPDLETGAHLVVAVWAFIALFKIRLYALKVQDRVIRLEERLRLREVVPADLQGRIGEFTEGQLIGLRFASDGELTELAQKALAQKMGQKEIKQSVKSWRPDFWRV